MAVLERKASVLFQKVPCLAAVQALLYVRAYLFLCS